VSIALKAAGLHTYYDKSHILHGVYLQVEEGEIVTVLGLQWRGKNHPHAHPDGTHSSARRRH